jgi:hypothetical protein
MNEKQVNIDLQQFDNISLNLEILAEEAAEIIQIKSKIMRFGLDDYHPESKIINRKKLEEELGHLEALVDILIFHGIISKKGIKEGKQAKLTKLPKWYQK